MKQETDLAEKLFGNKRLETGSEKLTTTTIIGKALTDSENGYVEVEYDGNITYGDFQQNIVPTGPNVKAGDTVLITATGGVGKSMSVTNVQGWGDRLDKGVLEVSALIAEKADIEYLEAEYAHITEGVIDNAKIDHADVNDLEANYAHITSGVIDNAKIGYADVEDLDANFAHITEGVIDNAKIGYADVEDLDANFAHITEGVIDNAKIGYADVNGLNANYAHITNGNIDNATIGYADVNGLNANYAHITNGTIDNAKIGYADVNGLNANYAHITNGAIDNAKIGYADVNDLEANYAQISFENVTNSWIENGVIRNGAIQNEMVQNVSASKLTAGTIDASKINVANLSADNLIVRRINGQPVVGGYTLIGTTSPGYSSKNPSQEGWYELSNGAFVLTQDTSVQEGKPYYQEGDEVALYDQTYIDNMKNQLNQRIDGAVETFTGTAVPTLTNYPYNTWYDTSLTPPKDERASHVGDIYFVTNPALDQDGYSYRFAYDNTSMSYMWVLIKDSDVTKALSDITDLQTFESNTVSWQEETDEGLTVIRQNHTSLSGVVDKTVKESVQLWFTKANTTAPSKPTAQVTSTSTDGNGWRTVVPSWNASYPNYYYCWQFKLADNTYAWSDVVRDIAMGESQGTSRSAQTTANANIKSSVQLWFTKANSTAPSKPTAQVTTNNAATGNAWNLAVPTYNASYPHYFYCYQQQKGDGTYQWSDVVYDKGTTEAMQKAQAALPSSTFTTFQSTTFKNLVDEVDEQSSTINQMSEKITTTARNLLTATLSPQNGGVRTVRGTGEEFRNESKWYTYHAESTLTRTDAGIRIDHAGGASGGITIPLIADGILADGEKLTLSFDYRGNYTALGTLYVLCNPTPNSSQGTPVTLDDSGEWAHYEYSWTYKANANVPWAILIEYYNSAGKWLEIRDGSMILERGAMTVTTLTNTVNSVKQTADANTASITGLTTTTQSLRDDLDNLEIGGRNLFKDSETISTSSWTYENASNSNGVAEVLTTGSGNHRIYQMPANGYWSWEPGTEYVASIEAKCSGDNGKLQMNPIGAAVTWKEFPLTTEWKRYAYVFTSGSGVTTGSMSFYNTGASGTVVYLRKPKLEKGNKATDWSPAPEDVQGSITTLESRSSKIEQTLDGFSSTVGAIVDETVVGTNILTGNALNPYNWTISAPTGANYTKTAYGTAGVKVQFSAISGYEWLYSPAITVVSGKKYTLSVEYTVGKDYIIASGKGGYGLSVYKTTPPHSLYDNANANFIARAQFFETATRVAMKATVTFTASSNTVYLGLNGGQINDSQTGLEFTMDKLTLVENISSRMSSAETSITQTSNAIGLTASGTTTIANPNLTPWFAMPKDDVYNASTNPKGYWSRIQTNSQFSTYEMQQEHNGSGGWCHLAGTVTSGNPFVRFEPRPISLKPSTQYTFVLELDGTAASTFTNIVWKFCEASETDAFDLFSSTAEVTFQGGMSSGTYYRTATTNSNMSSAVTLSRSYVQFYGTGAFDVYARISLYEGNYKGSYKPYSGSQLYASQAELKVANDAISARVEKNGVIASINASVETSGGSAVKISADKVNIEGATIFTTGRLSSTSLNNAYDSKGSASAVQSNLDNLEIGGRNLVLSSGSLSRWAKCGRTYGTITIDGPMATITASGNTANRYLGLRWWVNAPISELGEVVVSFDVMSPNWSAVAEPSTYTGLAAFGIQFNSTDNDIGSDAADLTSKAYVLWRLDNTSRWKSVPTAANGKWLHFESKPFTFNSSVLTTDSSKGIGVNIAVYPMLRCNGTVSIRNFKLEKGKKATDWSTAPEDADVRYDGVNLAKNSADIPRYVQSNVTSIVGGKVDPDGGTGAYLVTPSASSWWLSVRADDCLLTDLEPVYTASVWLRADNATTCRLCVRYMDNALYSSTATRVTFDVGTTWKRYSVSGALLQAQTSDCFWIGQLTTEPIYVYHPKIEKGDKPTDWTPSPDDFASASDAVEYIVGTQTAATGSWTGVTKEQALVAGKTISYKLPYAGSGNASLQLKDSAGNNVGGNIPVFSMTTRVTTHYPAQSIIQMTYDGTNWRTSGWYNTDANARYIQYYNTIVAGEALHAASIIGGSTDGKYYQIAGSGDNFDLARPLLWLTTDLAANATNYASIYTQTYDRNLGTYYTSFASGAANKIVYLVGTVSGNTFTVYGSNSSQYLTCTEPTSANGLVYIPIGRLGNQSDGKTYFNYSVSVPATLFAYIDGKFRQVTPTDIVATQKVYYRSKVSGTVPVPTTWITLDTDKYNDTISVGNGGWSIKKTAIAASTAENATKYLYLYTCEQRKRLDGTVECGKVTLDDATTVIDGGKIITHTISADKIKVSEINVGALGGSIGGTNLILYSNDQKLWGTYAPTGYSIANKVLLSENLVKGEKYTITIWGSQPTRSDKSSCWYAVYWGGGSISLVNVTIGSNGKGSMSFTAPNSSHADASNAWLSIYNTPSVGATGTTYGASITKMKLERGDRATDWSASPEDEIARRRAVYATCSTAAGTAAKVAACDKYQRYTGSMVTVTFSTANTATTPTLNVNSTGAATIKGYTGAALTEAEYKWAAGATITFTFDGTYWRMQDGGALQAKADAASSASTATSKATAASNSATAAANSATAASGSASTASDKATAASNSATAAAGSASTASTKATAASNSATAAANSATAAANSASTASDKATAASNSATAAANSATEAANRDTAFFGTCGTAAGTQAKVVACTNFKSTNLKTGTTIVVRCSTEQTYVSAKITLNVNSTGAKDVYAGDAVTSATNQVLWAANAMVTFVYNGSQWVIESDPRNWFGACTTAAGTQAKAGTLNMAGAVVCKGTTVALQMSNANTHASPTLNVGSTAAKNLYIPGATTFPTVANGNSWFAGATVNFVFDGQYWRLQIPDSAKFATALTSNGVMVHKQADTTTGVQITDQVDIVKSGNSVATFAANKIELGKNSKTATIEMCKGSAVIEAVEAPISPKDTTKSAMSLSGEVMGINSDLYTWLSTGSPAANKYALTIGLENDGDAHGIVMNVTKYGANTSTISQRCLTSISANSFSIDTSFLAASTADKGKIYSGFDNDKLGIAPVPLYANESAAFSGSITLSETAANFTRLELFCKDNDGRYCYTQVHNPNGKTVNVTQTLSYGGNFYVKSRAFSINAKVVDTASTSGTYHTGEVNAAGSNSGSSVDNIKIVKVLGYR